MGFGGYEYGYLRVTPRLLTRQGGRTSLSHRFVFFDAAGRGQPSPSRRFAFVNMAGREKPSLSYRFAFFDVAGREEPSDSCVCTVDVKWGRGTAGEGMEGVRITLQCI